MKSFLNIKTHLLSVVIAIILTFAGMIICSVSVEKYNQKDLQVELSDMEKMGRSILAHILSSR